MAVDAFKMRSSAIDIANALVTLAIRICVVHTHQFPNEVGLIGEGWGGGWGVHGGVDGVGHRAILG